MSTADHTTTGEQQQNRTENKRGTTTTSTPVLSTVYVDPVTGLYHKTAGVAGEHAMECSRDQADLLGHDPCRDCFRGAER